MLKHTLEVLGMKSNEFWLRFEWKGCFGLRETRGRQNRVFEKLSLCASLKTENPLILRDRYSWGTCEFLAKCLKCTGQLSQEAISREWLARELRDSLCKILEEMEIHFLIFATWVRETLLAKMPIQEFFNKTDLAFWKNFQNISDTPKHFQKQIKHLKIFLGLIIK